MSDGMSSDDDDCNEVNDDVGRSIETEEHHDLEVLETNERPEDFCIDVDPIDDCSVAEGHSQEVVAEGPLHEVSLGWAGFKIVGDNVDKNIWPSYQHVNHQTVSLHYFHSCAVGDRIDLSFLSDIAPSHISLSPTAILPSVDDLDASKMSFKFLLAGILIYCNYIYI